MTDPLRERLLNYADECLILKVTTLGVWEQRLADTLREAAAALAVVPPPAPEGPLTDNAGSAQSGRKGESQDAATRKDAGPSCLLSSHDSPPAISAPEGLRERTQEDHDRERITQMAPEGPQGWQPIATAPKDGTNFLAVSPAGSVFYAHWTNGLVDSASYDEVVGYRGRRATMWMPLPAPPRPEATPKEER